jgi:hypothetical protein
MTAGLGVLALIGCLTEGAALAQQAVSESWTAPRAPDGKPDLQGVWDFSTLTPLERPNELAAKAFLTEEEAAQYVQQRIYAGNADRRDGIGTEIRPGEDLDVALAYNQFWWARGTTIVPTRRTSLVIDPLDGKLPPLTAEGQKRVSALAAFLKQGIRGPLESARTRPVRERCIWWESTGPPLAPNELGVGSLGAYNTNLQLVQNEDHVAIVMEMIHDARIIPLDGRPHLPSSIRHLLGDSRGRWEGDTLVVDTTNFMSTEDFIDPGASSEQVNYRGRRRNMHLTERLTLIDADTLRYEYTVDDPTTWTRPWTAQQFLARSKAPLYEYACHEGNIGIAGVLAGARVSE